MKIIDYSLPEKLIAQYPTEKRDASRLMIVDRKSRKFIHTQFSELGEFLPPESLLLLNDTKVIPARLIGRKSTGAKIEVFLVRWRKKWIWEALIKPAKRVKSGTKIEFGNGNLIARVVGKSESNLYTIHFTSEFDLDQQIDLLGEIPLPPYIKRPPIELDKDRYQSVYAKSAGAVAAPTAGLHFRSETIERLKNDGFQFGYLTLHVGLGTFQPLRAENIEQKKLHSEAIEISEKTATLVNEAKRSKRKIVAVGTTSVRAIESAVSANGTVEATNRDTDIFIYPGYQFKIVELLLTNFHLSRSSLLLLVAAFADEKLIKEAYAEAIEREYRFYSYGDAMLII